MEKIANNMKRCIENGLDRTNNYVNIVNLLIMVLDNNLQYAHALPCSFVI